MKSIRYLAAFTGFALLLASGWCSAALAQGPAVNSHAGLPEAGTGCGYFPDAAPAAPARPQERSSPSERQFRQASLVLVSAQDHDWDRDSDPAPIVGLWKFQFVSKGNGTIGIKDGTVLDAGFVTWHSDGTEIMNSGRPPMTGSFCMGVWEKIGRSTYKLNHFALSWNPAGTSLIGPTNIKEEIVLDQSENSYSGTFTIDQYDNDGNILPPRIYGEVSAQRITVD